MGALAVAVMAAAGCGGSEGGEPAETLGPALPAHVCDLLSELERTESSLSPPEVFALDARALDAVLASRRAILGDISPELTGPLRRRLDRQLAAQESFDAAMLDEWDDERLELAGNHSAGIPHDVWGESVRLADGEEVSHRAYWWDATVVHERLVIGCRAPELADGPVEDTSEDPPPGRIVFVRPGEGLAVTDTSGADERMLDQATGWQATGGLGVAPGVDDIIVVNARKGDEYGLVAVDEHGQLEFVVSRRSVELVCPQLDASGELVLATDNDMAADTRRVHLINTRDARASGPLALPFSTASCADFLPDGRLVVGHAAREHGDPRGVWTVERDGSDPQQVWTVPDGCNSLVGDVDPDGGRVTVQQICFDPLESGIWVVDLASGAADHIAVGRAGPAMWSPDGSWLVFGLQRLGHEESPSVWMARPDGSQLRKVVEESAYTPVWLPPA